MLTFQRLRGLVTRPNARLFLPWLFSKNLNTLFGVSLFRVHGGGGKEMPEGKNGVSRKLIFPGKAEPQGRKI